MSSLSALPMFFLASNSNKGYANLFKSCYRPETGWKAFVLKGCCGTGKALLLKKIAKELIQAGGKVTLVTNVNDPKSLDGIICEDKGVIIYNGDLDNSAVEKYPAVCEKTIDMSAPVDEKILDKFKPKIVDGLNSAREKKRRAYAYISAASAMLDDNRLLAAECTDSDKAARFAENLAAREFPAGKSAGSESLRFLSGITPNGMIYYRTTADKICERTIVISDEHGAASSVIAETLRNAALKRGLDIITCRCPVSVGNKIEHIIIPSLSLAFLTANRFLEEGEPERLIHSRRFSDVQLIKKHRQRLRFNRKAAAELLDNGALLLSAAAADIETVDAMYNAATDFSIINDIESGILKRIL